MSKIIGLTGGIGSGKTTVANYLASLGIPVYIADIEAKKILDSPEVVERLRSEFGEDIIADGKADRKKLAKIVFDDSRKLEKLNSIVHPAVREHFRKWLEEHNAHDIVVKEAAILFESGTYKEVDAIIHVTAPEEIRIRRVMDRDDVSREDVLARMKNQWSDHKKSELSDFNVLNVNISDMQQQINDILKKLRNF